jgi:hypothetical protein
MKNDLNKIIDLLNKTSINDWSKVFVEQKIYFWKKYCMGLIFSTIHGADFFNNVNDCLTGTKTWKHDGEYEENFRKFIKHYKNS